MKTENEIMVNNDVVEDAIDVVEDVQTNDFFHSWMFPAAVLGVVGVGGFVLAKKVIIPFVKKKKAEKEAVVNVTYEVKSDDVEDTKE